MATGGAVRTIKPSVTSTAVHWSDLPGDILVMVCCRLTGHGRICFAATCRSWRAAAAASRPLAPPSLPWFLYDDDDETEKRRLYCPEYGSVLSMSLRIDMADKQVVGFHDGGWVAMLGHDLQLSIVNLFSGTEVALSTKQKGITSCWHHGGPCVIRKIIFSEAPTSRGCILAAITRSFGLALCGVGCPGSGWTKKHVGGAILVDIAFCNGQLYGLKTNEEIVKFEIGVNKDRATSLWQESYPDNSMVNCDAHLLRVLGRGVPLLAPSYIIELHGGKVGLVVRTWYNDEPTFKVLELSHVAMAPYAYEWQEVTSLGEYALFLGQAWSKTVYVPPGGRGLVQRNHIYSYGVVYMMIPDEVCHMQDRGNGLQMIKSAESYATGGPQGGMWLPPLEF